MLTENVFVSIIFLNDSSSDESLEFEPTDDELAEGNIKGFQEISMEMYEDGDQTLILVRVCISEEEAYVRVMRRARRF